MSRDCALYRTSFLYCCCLPGRHIGPKVFPQCSVPCPALLSYLALGDRQAAAPHSFVTAGPALSHALHNWLLVRSVGSDLASA